MSDTTKISFVPNKELLDSNEIAYRGTLDRFDTIQKLAFGYFHSISNNLSVIIGQSEYLKEYFKECERNKELEQVKKNFEKIMKAALRLNQSMEQLRYINTVGKSGFTKEVSMNEFAAQLPHLVSGYVNQIRDTKNINIRIDNNREEEIDFTLPYSDIFDYVLPFILTLMESSVCSGAIKISLAGYKQNKALILHFPMKLIGNENLDRVVQDILQYSDYSDSDRYYTTPKGTCIKAYSGTDNSFGKVVISSGKISDNNNSDNIIE